MPSRRAAASLLVAACLCACQGQPPVNATAAPGTGPAPVFEPVPRSRLPTTDGQIYLTNLDAQIDILEQRHGQRPSPLLATSLANQRLQRYRILDRREDLVRSLELATALGSGPAARLTQARVLAAVHRFDEALSILDGLAERGVGKESVQPLRQDILRALGRDDDSAPSRPDLISLAREGNQLLDRGRLGEAMARFHLAERSYSDTHPYPLAWLYTQAGIGYLRYGQFNNAIHLFDAALDRLPGLVVALDHRAEAMAALGREAEAIVVYRALVKTTGNPEFCGILAQLLAARGDQVEARGFHRCALEGFDEAMQQWPLATLAHAADYFLAVGAVERAMGLARRNAEGRDDVGARLLLARSALAAGNVGLACRVLSRMQRQGLSPPELVPLRSRCPGSELSRLSESGAG